MVFIKPVKHIVDTTLRDGEQRPGLAMSKAQKLMIAQLLDSAGIHQIEAGTPAVGSYEIETVAAIVQNRKNAKISVWNRMRLDDIKKAVECSPDIIHISLPVSHSLICSKLNKDKTWLIKNISACVDYARERNFEVTVGFLDASRADITFMTELANHLRGLGVSRIRFADTVGVLTPAETYRAVAALIGRSGIAVEIHTHNDLGMSVANAVTAAKAGADYIDTTVLGIGERAGNCDFLDFISAARHAFDMGVSAQEARRLQDKVSDMLRAQLSADI